MRNEPQLGAPGRVQAMAGKRYYEAPRSSGGTDMKVTVHILPTRKETRRLTLDDGSTVESAIRRLGLYPDQWIALRDDEPLPVDEVLDDGDVLKLVAVVSGG